MYTCRSSKHIIRRKMLIFPNRVSCLGIRRTSIFGTLFLLKLIVAKMSPHSSFASTFSQEDSTARKIFNEWKDIELPYWDQVHTDPQRRHDEELRKRSLVLRNGTERTRFGVAEQFRELVKTSSCRDENSWKFTYYKLAQKYCPRDDLHCFSVCDVILAFRAAADSASKLQLNLLSAENVIKKQGGDPINASSGGQSTINESFLRSLSSPAENDIFDRYQEFKTILSNGKKAVRSTLDKLSGSISTLEEITPHALDTTIGPRQKRMDAIVEQSAQSWVLRLKRVEKTVFGTRSDQFYEQRRNMWTELEITTYLLNKLAAQGRRLAGSSAHNTRQNNDNIYPKQKIIVQLERTACLRDSLHRILRCRERNAQKYFAESDDNSTSTSASGPEHQNPSARSFTLPRKEVDNLTQVVTQYCSLVTYQGDQNTVNFEDRSRQERRNQEQVHSRTSAIQQVIQALRNIQEPVHFGDKILPICKALEGIVDGERALTSLAEISSFNGSDPDVYNKLLQEQLPKMENASSSEYCGGEENVPAGAAFEKSLKKYLGELQEILKQEAKVVKLYLKLFDTQLTPLKCVKQGSELCNYVHDNPFTAIRSYFFLQRLSLQRLPHAQDLAHVRRHFPDLYKNSVFDIEIIQQLKKAKVFQKVLRELCMNLQTVQSGASAPSSQIPDRPEDAETTNTTGPAVPQQDVHRRQEDRQSLERTDTRLSDNHPLISVMTRSITPILNDSETRTISDQGTGVDEKSTEEDASRHENDISIAWKTQNTHTRNVEESLDKKTFREKVKAQKVPVVGEAEAPFTSSVPEAAASPSPPNAAAPSPTLITNGTVGQAEASSSPFTETAGEDAAVPPSRDESRHEDDIGIRCETENAFTTKVAEGESQEDEQEDVDERPSSST